MTDEFKLRQQQERGQRARMVLDNELVKEAFESIEKTVTEAWKNSAAEDERGRYNAYLMQRLLQNFRDQFTRAVSTGKVAEKELLRIHDKSKLSRILNA